MNFKWYEINCKHCGNQPKLTRELLDFLNALQDFRDWYGKTMDLNCGYRCPTYNKSVGGHYKSNHLNGTAIDWGIKKITKGMSDARLKQWRYNIVEKWLELGKKYGYYVQVEICNTYIHLAFNTNCDKGRNRIGLYNGAKNTDGSRFKNYLSKGAYYYGRY